MKRTAKWIVAGMLLAAVMLNCSDDDDAVLCSVYYSANGATSGTVPADTNSYSSGSGVVLLSNSGTLLRYGAYFDGWTNSSGELYTPGSSFVIQDSSLTLFAAWKVPETRQYSSSNISFKMKMMPGGFSFYSGLDDNGGIQRVTNSFEIAETELLYSQWSNVYVWATNNGYLFANPGRQGGAASSAYTGAPDHPVTTVNWRDAMIWCNALTGYFNLHNGTAYTYVYKKTDGTVLSNSTDANRTNCDTVMPDETADGFRLLRSAEWAFAARFISDDGDKILNKDAEYYPGEFVTGSDSRYDISATNDYDRDGLTNSSADVAWSLDNSSGESKSAKQKLPNPSGLYDLCGNAYEWCFDWHPDYVDNMRTSRGGGFTKSDFHRIGYLNSGSPHISWYSIGFRIARTP